MGTTDNCAPYDYPQGWIDEVAKLNIYQRLHCAMADAKPVAKTTKDGIKFSFHGHEGVSAMVKALAEKWRFVIESSVIDHRFEITEIYGKPRPLCILTVRARFINIDRPDEFSETVTIGYGVDESDKGPGKALSYALKMAQLKALLIHDGEKLNNEEFCYEHEREEKKLAELRKKWMALVKTLKLDMKEEGARLKREYGDPPSIEGIQIDCDEMEAEIARNAERARKSAAKPEPEPTPEPTQEPAGEAAP